MDLTTDCIVYILAQDRRLLGMAHYLSKAIAIRARPFQLRMLMNNRFTLNECSSVYSPAGFYRQVRHPSRVLIWICEICIDDEWWSIGIAKENGRVCVRVEETISIRLAVEAGDQPDLYTSRELYRARGATLDRARELVIRTLDEMYHTKRTLGDVMHLYAFLLLHRSLFQGTVIFVEHMFKGTLGKAYRSWKKQTKAKRLIRKIDEMYIEIRKSLYERVAQS